MIYRNFFFQNGEISEKIFSEYCFIGKIFFGRLKYRNTNILEITLGESQVVGMKIFRNAYLYENISLEISIFGKTYYRNKFLSE